MTQLKNLKRELLKIKKNESSFLGIDGGNINSDIWICGLEFGSDLNSMEEFYNTNIRTKNIEGFDVPYRTECSDYFMKSKYDRFLSALYISLFENEKLTTPVIPSVINNYLQNNLYNLNSKIFKLNLYPLAKKDINWDKKIESDLEIQKEDYYGYYFENRKAFLKILVEKFKPKLIICTATKSYKDDFIETFYDSNKNIELNWNYFKTQSENKFKISEYDNGSTKVLIIPFLGRGNLSSYNDVIDMANYIKKKYKYLIE